MNQRDPNKKALRARLRQRMMAVEPADLHARSAQAAERVIDTPEFHEAGSVMLFLSLPHEVESAPLALEAWQRDKQVTVPLVSYQQKHMLPVTINSLDEAMDTDRYGVRSPRYGQPYPIEMLDLVVVPGLGFDDEGHRIGRGGGFYDRFLTHPSFHGTACGIAMDEQIVDQVPVSTHDANLDMLVTDRRLVRFQPERA